MWTKMGPVWLLKPPPPPQAPKHSKMFSTYEKLIIYCFLCCTYVSSVMRSSWHFSTSGFNIRFPKKKLITNFHQITSIFYMLLEDSFGVKSISKFAWGLEAYIKKCLWVLLTHVYWFRATGGYICGCGRPSNLVYTDLGRPGVTFAVAGDRAI